MLKNTNSVASDPLQELFCFEENLNACLTVALKELEDRFALYPALRPTWHALKGFLRRRGKRIRPLLFLYSYHLFDRAAEVPPVAAFRAATALEIFHAFALVHDDIIDASHSRRGAPTLHKRLESEGDLKVRDAENLAIVFGDILFGFAMECLLDPGFAPERSTRAMRMFLRVSQDTGLGQAVEIAHLGQPLGGISEEEILQTYFLKTTRYTIECPLILGAILGGANDDVERALRGFAHPLGLAFQIENDLHEVGQLSQGQHDMAYDLHLGVKTLFLKRLHQSLPPAQQRILDRSLGQVPGPEIAQLLNSREAQEVTRALQAEVRTCFREAQAALRDPIFDSEHRLGLEGFAEFIRSNSHHSETVSPALATA